MNKRAKASVKNPKRVVIEITSKGWTTAVLSAGGKIITRREMLLTDCGARGTKPGTMQEDLESLYGANRHPCIDDLAEAISDGDHMVVSECLQRFTGTIDTPRRPVNCTKSPPRIA